MASSGRSQSPAVRLQQADQISDLHLSHHNATDSPHRLVIGALETSPFGPPRQKSFTASSATIESAHASISMARGVGGGGLRRRAALRVFQPAPAARAGFRLSVRHQEFLHSRGCEQGRRPVQFQKTPG